MALTSKKTKGECEACDKVDVELTMFMPGSILMCESCYADNKTAVERSKAVNALIATDSFKQLSESRHRDSEIELKQDLFNAGTVSFVELQAAIENNPEIAPEQRNYRLMEEVAERIKSLDAVIFADENALIAKKNERHALLVNAQNVAAKLHEKEREKFKQYDVNYKPVTPKTVKPKAIVKKTTKAFSMADLKAACAKYNVPLLQVQRMCVARNMSAEDAAKELASAMGLL